MQVSYIARRLGVFLLIVWLDASLFRHRHLARSAARLAAGTALDALANAAPLGIARDPVFLARADPDLPLGLSGAAAADLRRVFGGRHADRQLELRLGPLPARAIAGVVDHSGLDRRLGTRDARH